VRALACLLCLLLSLTGLGCNTFGKKRPTPPTQPAGGSAPAAAEPATPPATADRSNPSSAVGGLLAGQVIPPFGNQPPVTYIQVVCKDEQGAPAAPIEVATDAQGYFTIQGLKPGRPYQLLARARDADGMLAAAVFATPPNPKVIVNLRADLVSSTTPALPADPAWPGSTLPRKDVKPGPYDPKPTPAATLEQPQPAPGGGKPPADLGAPRPMDSLGAAPNPSLITDGGRLANNGHPIVNMPGSEPLRPRFDQPLAPLPGPPPAQPQPRIPSALVVDRQIMNFALYDLDGRPYEFPRTPHGRLVLLDFWGTWCNPCLNAIRGHLVDMDTRYRSYGLEVIGISYESGVWEEQTRRVRAIRDRLSVNYRLLMGGDSKTCPLATQLGIQAFPTLILLDEYGHILWRGTGADPGTFRDLEYEVRRRLGLR
jgi:thiol-disulfide isomerase/thioredoxin